MAIALHDLQEKQRCGSYRSFSQTLMAALCPQAPVLCLPLLLQRVWVELEPKWLQRETQTKIFVQSGDPDCFGIVSSHTHARMAQQTSGYNLLDHHPKDPIHLPFHCFSTAVEASTAYCGTSGFPEAASTTTESVELWSFAKGSVNLPTRRDPREKRTF